MPEHLDTERRVNRGVRAASGGGVAAMAMTGVRVVTTQLGLLEQVPPERIVADRAPKAFRALPKRYRRVAVELLHWSYGALGGGLFGLLPARVRDNRWAGPAYGVGMWLTFEVAIRPVLGLRRPRRREVRQRLALIADHLLYGMILTQASRARP